MLERKHSHAAISHICSRSIFLSAIPYLFKHNNIYHCFYQIMVSFDVNIVVIGSYDVKQIQAFDFINYWLPQSCFVYFLRYCRRISYCVIFRKCVCNVDCSVYVIIWSFSSDLVLLVDYYNIFIRQWLLKRIFVMLIA